MQILLERNFQKKYLTRVQYKRRMYRLASHLMYFEVMKCWFTFYQRNLYQLCRRMITNQQHMQYMSIQSDVKKTPSIIINIFFKIQLLCLKENEISLILTRVSWEIFVLFHSLNPSMWFVIIFLLDEWNYLPQTHDGVA